MTHFMKRQWKQTHTQTSIVYTQIIHLNWRLNKTKWCTNGLNEMCCSRKPFNGKCNAWCNMIVFSGGWAREWAYISSGFNGSINVFERHKKNNNLLLSTILEFICQLNAQRFFFGWRTTWELNIIESLETSWLEFHLSYNLTPTTKTLLFIKVF